MTEYEDVELVPDVTVANLAKAALFAALTAVLSQLSIPLPGGIPFSLQPFAVFLAGLVLGPVWGGFALLVYVAAGVAGAPVFSNGAAGFGYVTGATGGFLVSFVVAAVAIGAIAHRQGAPRPVGALSAPLTALALAGGLVVIYAIGLPWAAAVNDWSLRRAGTFFAPYAATDVVKAGVALGIVHGSHLLDELA